MIFQITETNQTLWFPFASVNDAPENYVLFLIVEVILNVLCGFVTLRCVGILLSTGIIHSNLCIVISVLFIQWFEVLIARVVLLPYQYGFLKIDDSNQGFSSFWSSDPAEIMPVKSFNSSLILLYVCALFQWHYNFSVFYGIGGIVFERLFATIHVKDYEQKSRKFIPAVVIVCNQILAIPMAFQTIYIRISMEFLIGLTVVFMPTVIIAYCLVVRLNTYLVTSSLSQKFQIKENLRALVMIRNVMIFGIAYAFLTCVLFFLLVFKFIETYSGIWNRVLENVIYLNPIFFSFGIMYCSDVWWEEFTGFQSARRQERRVAVYKDETTLYFEQLRSAWA